jgi:hypothetical protein
VSEIVDAPSWSTAFEPVRRGPRTGEVITVADMATAVGIERMVELLRPHTGGVRKAAVTAVHYALSVVVTLVVDPFVRDGLQVEAAPDQIGFFADADQISTAYWVGGARLSRGGDPNTVGATVGATMRPVMAAVARRARVGARGLDLIVLDSLGSQIRRFDRPAGRQQHSAWITTLLDATGIRTDVPVRTFDVVADAGPPVEFSVPRVCCVLSNQLSEHPCPTCPNYPDDATRRGVVTEWLDGMADDEFAEVTGRARVPMPRPAAG